MKITSARFETSAFGAKDERRIRGPLVVFLGRSNVGKSSLINILLGAKELARTSSTPGRTQSVNLFVVNERFRFVDLPGYGYARAPESLRRSWKEEVGGFLERRRAEIALAVLVLDARHPPSALDGVMRDWLLAKAVPSLVAGTKADKVPAGRRVSAERVLGEFAEAGPGWQAVLVSARTGMGIRRVWSVLDASLGPRPRDGSVDGKDRTWISAN